MYLSPLVGENSAWCVSFVNYCFNKVGVTYPTSHSVYSLAYIGNKNFFKLPNFFWALFEYQKEAVVGMLHLFLQKKESSELLCLGGNQADQLRLSTYSVSGQESKYYLPLLYTKYYEANKSIFRKTRCLFK